MFYYIKSNIFIKFENNMAFPRNQRNNSYEQHLGPFPNMVFSPETRQGNGVLPRNVAPLRGQNVNVRAQPEVESTIEDRSRKSELIDLARKSKKEVREWFKEQIEAMEESSDSD